MATTTNFGWETPDDTDLVKDGAAAMRTLGSAIDTSFVDLKGGTTGQILSKASNTDLDYTWITNDVGDITAVNAGTGISGGGTTGAVTITNSMATEIAAAGDIIVGTGSATFDNLPIGTTGQVLTADTTVSPYKVKWATPAGGLTFSGVMLGNSATQSFANNTAQAVTWSSETFDTDGFHSTSSNTSRITIPTGKAGYYSVGGMIQLNTATAGDRALGIRVNNVLVKEIQTTPSANYPSMVIETVLSLAVGDYVEMFIFQNSGSAQSFYVNGNIGQFYATYLGV